MNKSIVITENEKEYEKAIFGLMFHGCQRLTIDDAKKILYAIEQGKVPFVKLEDPLKRTKVD